MVGLDTSFGFRQMCVASSYIQRGALFLGTNPDVADRVGSLLMPGTGPILASIQTASGVRPLSSKSFEHEVCLKIQPLGVVPHPKASRQKDFGELSSTLPFAWDGAFCPTSVCV